MRKINLVISMLFLLSAGVSNLCAEEIVFPGIPPMEWSQRLIVEVLNPENKPLENMPVTIPLTEFQLEQPSFADIGYFRVYDSETGNMPLYQVDDPDGDGPQPAEIVFLTTLKSQEKRNYEIHFYQAFKAWPQQLRYTDATEMPGWESELFGYRSYGAFIIDLFGKYKNQPGLVLKTFYNESNRQIYNYHVDSPLGMDILHVGPTIGLGGIALKSGEQVLMPSAGAITSQVIVSGPVRSIVTMKKSGWKNEIGTFDITRTALIYAHHFATHVKDVVTVVNLNTQSDALPGTGIKKEKNMNYFADPEKGLFLLWHLQPMYDIGEMGMGLYLKQPRAFLQTEDANNYYYLLNQPLKSGISVEYDFAAFGAWKRAGYIPNMEAFKAFANELVLPDSPITVNILDFQNKSEKKQGKKSYPLNIMW